MISDERLREAARQAEKNLLSSLPEPEDCEATFAPKFKRKMEKLVRRTDHPIRYWVQKVVACILLVILLGGGSVLALSTEARAAFVGWVREIYETWLVYRYIGENQSNPKDIFYYPAWIPDGYYESSRFATDAQTTIIYEDNNNNLITFYYAYDADATSIHLEQEDVDIKSVWIGNLCADLYVDEIEGNANSLVWVDEKNGVLFWIAANCNEEELIKIAEGVVAE